MKLVKHFFALVFLLLASQAHSSPIVDEFGNISNLNVDGSLYDVTWNFSSDPVLADFDLFNGNSVFANTFMSAVKTAFEDEGFTRTPDQVFYGVDYDLAGLTGVYLEDIGGTFLLADDFHGIWSAFSNAGWGSVTQVSNAVPAPKTIAMFTLLALFLVQSRKKKS